MIALVAPTSAAVLIHGETGTGKELVARSIHEEAPIKGRPFVAINCAAIPETLLESELFGHERGSFTSAFEQRAGCFEQARGGTLFLDEVSEMRPAMQVKLLRVLEEKTFRRVGGQKEMIADVRILAATNVEPFAAVKSEKLRADLYYRLNVFEIGLPPLREHLEDLELLCQSFLAFPCHLSTDAFRFLQAYHWPGNVRELRNVLERAVILCAGGITIEPEHLPAGIRGTAEPGRQPASLEAGMTLVETESRLIQITLSHTGGNRAKAARLLGISPRTLRMRLGTARKQVRLRGPQG
jgi:two-component system response regulator AtoC